MPGLVALVALGVFLVVAVRNLNTVPPVYEDEPWQASTAYKLLNSGVFGSDLFAGFYHMDQRYYGFMPLHPLLLAGFFRLLGIGLVQARLEVVCLSLATLVLTFALGARLFSAWVGAIAVVLLVAVRWTGLTYIQLTGIPFVDFARIARYDPMVPVIGLAALHVYLSARRGDVLAYPSPSAPASVAASRPAAGSAEEVLGGDAAVGGSPPSAGGAAAPSPGDASVGGSAPPAGKAAALSPVAAAFGASPPAGSAASPGAAEGTGGCRGRWFVYGLAGLLAGLAGLAHLYGLFWVPALLVLAIWDTRSPKAAALIGFGAVLPWLPYVAYVLSDVPDWRGQTAIYGNRFDLLNPSWYLDNLTQEFHRYGPGLGAVDPGWLLRPGFWLTAVGLPLALAGLARKAVFERGDPGVTVHETGVTAGVTVVTHVTAGVTDVTADVIDAAADVTGGEAGETAVEADVTPGVTPRSYTASGGGGWWAPAVRAAAAGAAGAAAARIVVVPAVLFPLLFALFIRLKLVNYTLIELPLFAVVLAWGLAALWRRYPHARVRPLLAILGLAVAIEGTWQIVELELAAQRSTPYPVFIQRVRELLPAGSRVLGLHSYWFGLEDFDFRSFLLPLNWADEGVLLDEALSRVAPDVILIDPRLRAYFASPEVQVDHDRLQSWLDRHSVSLIGSVDDPTYGLMEVYRVQRSSTDPP